MPDLRKSQSKSGIYKSKWLSSESLDVCRLGQPISLPARRSPLQIAIHLLRPDRRPITSELPTDPGRFALELFNSQRAQIFASKDPAGNNREAWKPRNKERSERNQKEKKSPHPPGGRGRWSLGGRDGTQARWEGEGLGGRAPAVRVGLLLLKSPVAMKLLKRVTRLGKKIVVESLIKT
ncbi:hypothetical protein PGTUg99_006581 [Puccinia graminis f. sp. tritici]|uniref:Uncharacterized protein n=1 Tax=Puccinia graminis f. sp. tritici TaxID=56615 RepID=A0A5B0S4Y3_PUCGR|nr:hypothetical protein PGTUg99_006581 [Puccinia graminis f. sp. tritici]